MAKFISNPTLISNPELFSPLSSFCTSTCFSLITLSRVISLHHQHCLGSMGILILLLLGPLITKCACGV